MQVANPDSPRRGMTLIELLVVTFILGVLATLVGIYVVPSFRDNKNVIRGLDRVTITLMIAKQRALRDQAPRGVRFVIDPTGTYNAFTQLQLVELPDPFSGGLVATVDTTGKLLTFSGGVDFIGGAAQGNTTQYVVQPGDYFRSLVGTPTNYPILSPNGVTGSTSLSLLDAIPSQYSPAGTNQYQIIRQTRPIAGEAPISLPNNVVIDINTLTPAANATSMVPSGQFPTPTTTPATYEIVFDAGGAVMNRGGGIPIGLIIYDATADNPLDANTTRVLAVNPRTGMVAAHPVGPATNPLQYALDGRSSGM